ncbi:MAG: hypothetical protein N4A76_15925 [Firmicutes bacterium]|jgi:hypothetical protein|nr:hypothetical protein [Bacillota bacterium]
MSLVGDYRLHDSVIKNIDILDEKVVVELETMKKERLFLDLEGVIEIDRYKTDNMFIYSVIQEQYDENHCNVIFVNWHSKEEVGGDSKFEVVCENWSLREGK